MTIGVDVSKDELVCCARSGAPRSVKNSPAGVTSFLSSLSPGDVIAMEATGRYHRILADTAHSKGFTVIVHNPKDVSKYAKSATPRATTDPIMAKIIAEFTEIREHRAYSPAPGFVDTLKNLVRARAGLVKDRVGLQNQASEHLDLADYLNKAVDVINQSIAKLDEKIAQSAKTVPQYSLLIKVPGFGPLTTAYLITLLCGGDFARSDSFVAFIGLDLRVRESGKLKGKRKLSKRGDPEARRLLYLAALSACRTQGPFRDIYERHISKGLSKTEAITIVARKLARVAWSIYKRNQPYIADRVPNQTVAPASSNPDSPVESAQPRVGAAPRRGNCSRVLTANISRKPGIALDSVT